MKRLLAGIAPAIVAGLLSAVSAADTPPLIAVDSIKDRVTCRVGEEFSIVFQRDGDHLRQPNRRKVTDAKSGDVRIQFSTTSASPGPPPREGATRPFLTVENRFEKSLCVRTLVRLKGSKTFVMLRESGQPIEPGETFQKCWDFDTHIEELVLCDFRLIDEAGE